MSTPVSTISSAPAVVATPESSEHGVKTANWRKNPLNAVPYLDCMKVIESKFEGFELAKVLPVFTDDNLDELQAKIKKATRRQDKKSNKFVALGLKKPQSAIRLFQVDDLAKCSKEDRKGYIKNGLLSKHWKALTDAERASYETTAKSAREHFETEYKRQLTTAIETGAWQEPKPKRPMSAYFHFSMSAGMATECQKLGLKGIHRSKLISQRWKEISADQKKSYETLNEADKVRFEGDMVKYNERSEARKSGQVVSAAEPVVKAVEEKPVATPTTPAISEDSKKTAKAPSAKKASKKEKAEPVATTA